MVKYLSLQIERCGNYDKPIYSIGCVYFELKLDNMMRLVDINEYIPINIISEKLFNYTPKKPVDSIDSEGFIITDYGDFSEEVWEKYIEYDGQPIYSNEYEVLSNFLEYYKTLENPTIICEDLIISLNYLNNRLYYYKLIDNIEYLLNNTLDLKTLEYLILSGKNGKECLKKIVGECNYKPIANGISLAKCNAWLFGRLTNYIVN